MGPVHRAPIDEDQLHFGMRHTERLDGVFYARCARTLVCEHLFAAVSRQEVVELLVKSKLRNAHCLASRNGAPHTSAPSRGMPRPPSISSGTTIHEVKKRTVVPARSEPLTPMWKSVSVPSTWTGVERLKNWGCFARGASRNASCSLAKSTSPCPLTRMRLVSIKSAS